MKFILKYISNVLNISTIVYKSTEIESRLHIFHIAGNVNEEPSTINETNNLAAAVIDLQNSAENPRKKSKWNDRYSMKSP